MRILAPNTDPAVAAEFREPAETSWKILDAHIAGRKYIVGDRLTIADLSVCDYLFWDDELAVDWAQYPNIRDWLLRIRSEPHWKHPLLLPGHPIPAKAK